jgi:HEAT repeat protein
LGDPDANVRAGVAIFLGEQYYAIDGEEVVPALVRALEGDPSTYVRSEAAGSLGWKVSSCPAIVKPLLRALKEDKEASVREAAAWALWNTIRFRMPLLNPNAYPIAEPRAAAGEVLWYRSLERATVDGLLSALQDPVPRVRLSAILSLSDFGHCRGVLPALVHALEDEDLYVYCAVVNVLASSNTIDVPEMLKALGSNDPFVRAGAASSIGWSHDGQVPKAFHQPLIRLLRDPDHLVQLRAAQAIGRAKVSTDELVSAMCQVLRDEDACIRAGAALMLGMFGKGKEDAEQALFGALTDRVPVVRCQAACALANISAKKEKVIPVLIGLLCGSDESIRSSAAYCLRTIGSPALPALREIIKALDKNSETYLVATGSLAQIDPLEGARLGILEILVPDVGPYLTDPLAPKDWGPLRFHSRAIGSGPGYLLLEAECFRDQWETGYVLRGKVELAHLTKASLKVTDLRGVNIRYTDLDRATDGAMEKDIPGLMKQLYEPRNRVKWNGIVVISGGEDFDFSLPMKKLIRLGAKARPAMHKALSDPRIRNEAVIILGAIGDETTVPLLMALYPESDRRKTRHNVCDADPSHRHLLDVYRGHWRDPHILFLTGALTYLTGQTIGRDREGTDYSPENGRLWREWWARARNRFRVPNPKPYATCYPQYPRFKEKERVVVPEIPLPAPY